MPHTMRSDGRRTEFFRETVYATHYFLWTEETVTDRPRGLEVNCQG